MIFFALLMLGLAGSGLYIVLMSKGSKKQQQARRQKMMRRMYHFLSNFFITQGYISNVYSKLANLSVYRRSELQVLSVKYLLTSWGISGGLVASSFFLFEDSLTILIVVMFAFLITNIVVDKQLDKLHLQVTKASAGVFSSIRQEYMRSNNVVEALSDSDVPDIVKRPIEDIVAILTSNNAELKLQEFCEATPFRSLQTLAGICYHINNYGDDKDVYGQSNFIQALSILLSDVNTSIQNTIYRKRTFGFIEYLPFIPIFGMGFLESYFISIMPGTALIYSGPLGYLFRTVIVVLSVIAYVTISRINNNVPIKEDDRGDLILSLLEKPKIKQMVYNVSPKNKARVKLEYRLKNALSRMTPEQYKLKKLLYGFAGFTLALLCAMSTISLGRDFIENSTQQLSLVATGEMSEYEQKAIEQLDKKYLASPALYSDEDIKAMVQTAMPGLSDLQIQDQVKRLQSKATSLENAYFKWWYIWVCAIIGVVSYFFVDLALYLRRVLIETEEEDDFLQLQTLVSILMNTNMDTLDMLGQLAQHSRVHKDMFQHAYQGYPSNPELELTRLQSKTPLLEFKRFIGKLKLSISELSLKEAYGDLILEREHILRIRDMTVKAAINKKRTLCGILSMLPLGALILLDFLVPIGILGYNEFMNALSTM